MQNVVDPIEFASELWPDVRFYDKQQEIIYSVMENDETYVPAGNMMGKDFVAGFIALWFFISRHPCRVVTTSVDGAQLEGVLWGEIRRFIQTSKYPLPIVNNHLHLRKIVNKKVCPISYMLGRVAAKGEGLQGHHCTPESGDPTEGLRMQPLAKAFEDNLPRTLGIFDEASGVDQQSYDAVCQWAEHILIIGNPLPCTQFFFQGVKRGDVPAEDNGYFLSKVIKVPCNLSPNVRLAEAQTKNGKKPTGETLIPGVMGYKEYKKRRRLWDKVRQCMLLDAEFYEGAEVLLFPPEWLNLAEQKATEMAGAPRRAKAIGIDPAEGGDQTAMAAVDEYGLIELVSKKTPDTSVITGEAIAFMKKHGVKAENVVFDLGGGGKEHIDRLRKQGYNVQGIAFGGAASPDRRVGRVWLNIRKEEDEVQYTYKNRRSEMYGILSLKLDPVIGDGFTLAAEYTELRGELSPIPRTYDEEGRLYLLPKNKPISRTGKESPTRTLTELIGHSPDRADALVLAVFGMEERSHVQEAQFS